MKPYCVACSFGIKCHWRRQTNILSMVFPNTGSRPLRLSSLIFHPCIIILARLRDHLNASNLPGPGKVSQLKAFIRHFQDQSQVPEDGRLAYVRREPINARSLSRMESFKSILDLGPGKRWVDPGADPPKLRVVDYPLRFVF
ncbi:hypothetical protein EVAR_77132_1 [Eumeta japonica]|uniref:Uncharacterized protein n=1 Tax=Eumeta variegata TaxID=151549 RepID=A0A4C1T1T5_EUMVA|nr:hypothetical protein EVAR_77132_1 [Eumeta japonica]